VTTLSRLETANSRADELQASPLRRLDAPRRGDVVTALAGKIAEIAYPINSPKLRSDEGAQKPTNQIWAARGYGAFKLVRLPVVWSLPFCSHVEQAVVPRPGCGRL